MTRHLDMPSSPALPRGEGPTIFTWSTEPDHHAPRGKRYALRSPHYPRGSLSPLCADDRVAACGWLPAYATGGKRGHWEASFYVGYSSIRVSAGTAQAAMAALQREVDKLSIGLFGLDDITFIPPDAVPAGMSPRLNSPFSADVADLIRAGKPLADALSDVLGRIRDGSGPRTSAVLADLQTLGVWQPNPAGDRIA